MAIYNKGILGSFTGRLGNVIGTHWKGKAVMKSVPAASVKRTNSEAQNAQRIRFGIASKLLSTMLPAVEIGWYNSAKSARITEMNAAMSYTLKNAFEPDDTTIDYSKVLISKGEMHLPASILNISKLNKDVTFEWDWQNFDDHDTSAMCCLYCPELNDTLYGNIKAEENALTLKVPALWRGHEVHAWIYFATFQFDPITGEPESKVNKKMITNSYYCGNAQMG
jgi:hypothetical protein